MTNICLTKHPDVLYSPVKLKDLQKMIKGQEELYMSNSTLEGKKKTENGINLFCACDSVSGGIYADGV